MEPIQLNMLDGISKIRQAHAEGRLLAQVHPGSSGRYRGGSANAPCAIGVMLSDEDAQMFDSGVFGYVSIAGLTNAGAVAWPNDTHARCAAQIQGKHDCWLFWPAGDDVKSMRDTAEAEFLAALDDAELNLKGDRV